MPTINIDGKDYDSDKLNEKAKGQLASIQFVRGELNRLQAQIAALKTAELSYISVLKTELENSSSS